MAWSSLHYDMVTAAAALDRSGNWVWDGARTCAHWISAAVQVEVCTAREWIRVGHVLARATSVAEAFASGELSYSKVRTVSRLLTPDNEAALLDLARRTPASELSKAVARWLGDHESPGETERRQWDARSFSWFPEPDGMIRGTFRLPPVLAAVVISAVTAYVIRTRSTQSGRDASAGRSSPHSVSGWPSLAQQQADALVAVIRGGGTGIASEVVVHVRGDGATLDDGTPLADSAVAGMIPTSFIRALIHDADGRPVNASGRQRHPTDCQKRVVLERDRACVDCGATTYLDFDHDPPFRQSRRTVVDELVVRCKPCHHRRHGGTP